VDSAKRSAAEHTAYVADRLARFKAGELTRQPRIVNGHADLLPEEIFEPNGELAKNVHVVVSQALAIQCRDSRVYTAIDRAIAGELLRLRTVLARIECGCIAFGFADPEQHSDGCAYLRVVLGSSGEVSA
jgi:hypothetical protein